MQTKTEDLGRNGLGGCFCGVQTDLLEDGGFRRWYRKLEVMNWIKGKISVSDFCLSSAIFPQKRAKVSLAGRGVWRRELAGK